MGLRDDLAGLLASTFQEYKIWITLWRYQRSKNYQGMLDILRTKLKQVSDRLDVLELQGIPEEKWNSDWKFLNAHWASYYIRRKLEDCYPESIESMLDIMRSESPTSPIVNEMMHMLTGIQEQRAIPIMCEYLENEKDPDEIAELLWYLGKMGRVKEVVDANKPEGLLRYFDGDRHKYYSYADNEIREEQLPEMREELVPLIEPYLLHEEERVRITSFVALKKMRPEGSSTALEIFEKSHPHLDFDELRMEYAPESCFIGDSKPSNKENISNEHK